MNPAGNLYCDRCSARLIPAERVPPEEEKPERPSPPKGISLPSVPLGEEEWLSELRAEALDLAPEEETPGWPGELEAPGEPPTPDVVVRGLHRLPSDGKLQMPGELTVRETAGANIRRRE